MKHLDFIMDFESGALQGDDQAVIEGFQAMINDGTVWLLQGAYGRQAQFFIDAGLCTPAKEVD